MKILDKTTNQAIEISRKHGNGEHYTIDRKNMVVSLTDKFTPKGKKLGGSSFGAFLGNNPYASKFAESIRIMGLSEPMYEYKYVVAGIKIEPKIKKWLEEELNTPVTGYEAADYFYDYFRLDKTSYAGYGGLPDATIKTEDGETVIFEIKTTGIKNLNKWEVGGLPPYYVSQLQTYLSAWGIKHGRTPKTGVLVACFLKDEDYVKPDTVSVRNREIRTYEVPYNPDMTQTMLDAISGRQKIIDSRQSVLFNPFLDGELLKYLECTNENEYKAYLVTRGYTILED